AYGALLLVELGRFDEARGYVERARAHAVSGADRALAHNAAAALAYAGNDLPAAEQGFCTARDLSLHALAPQDPMIVTNASSCAVLKFLLERPDALAAIRLSSDHALAHLPPDHP